MSLIKQRSDVITFVFIQITFFFNCVGDSHHGKETGSRLIQEEVPIDYAKVLRTQIKIAVAMRL